MIYKSSLTFHRNGVKHPWPYWMSKRRLLYGIIDCDWGQRWLNYRYLLDRGFGGTIKGLRISLVDLYSKGKFPGYKYLSSICPQGKKFTQHNCYPSVLPRRARDHLSHRVRRENRFFICREMTANENQQSPFGDVNCPKG